MLVTNVPARSLMYTILYSRNVPDAAAKIKLLSERGARMNQNFGRIHPNVVMRRAFVTYLPSTALFLLDLPLGVLVRVTL